MEQQNIFCTLVFQFGFSCQADNYKIPAQQQAVNVACHAKNSELKSNNMNYKTISKNVYSVDSLQTADFGRRLSAALIDLFLLLVLTFFVRMAYPKFGNDLFFTPSSISQYGTSTIWIFKKSVLILVWITYSIIMDSTSFQGTVGKQIMGIAVTDYKGKRISFLQSLIRNTFKIVSYAILSLGFFNVLIDRNQRGWHDIIAGTLVIRK
jgi:uncharacterized RDD family membrane protein YckC